MFDISKGKAREYLSHIDAMKTLPLHLASGIEIEAPDIAAGKQALGKSDRIITSAVALAT